SIWLNRRNTTRRKSILKQLPMFLDYIILGVEAGMNFTGALGQTVDKGPAGPLRQEFFLVLRDVRAGLSRSDALRRMEERLMIPEISSFVSAIIQAEQVGASMGKILRLQADRPPQRTLPARREAGHGSAGQTDFSAGGVHFSDHLHHPRVSHL
ncbi:Type II secretion system F domain protein, partial [mine drainage metagenome]